MATALGNNYLVAINLVNNTVGFICLIILGLNQLVRRNVSADYGISAVRSKGYDLKRT